MGSNVALVVQQSSPEHPHQNDQRRQRCESRPPVEHFGWLKVRVAGADVRYRRGEIEEDKTGDRELLSCDCSS
jgi:hypothetical protein